MEFQRAPTDRQRVRLILADLTRANAIYERTPGKEAKATLLELRAEAQQIVERLGWFSDRERLAALLKLPLVWMIVVPLPI